jgi:hypothetical protein
MVVPVAIPWSTRASVPPAARRTCPVKPARSTQHSPASAVGPAQSSLGSRALPTYLPQVEPAPSTLPGRARVTEPTPGRICYTVAHSRPHPGGICATVARTRDPITRPTVRQAGPTSGPKTAVHSRVASPPRSPTPAPGRPNPGDCATVADPTRPTQPCGQPGRRLGCHHRGPGTRRKHSCDHGRARLNDDRRRWYRSWPVCPRSIMVARAQSGPTPASCDCLTHARSD